MRYLFLILILLPFLSYSQVRELIKEYKSNFKVIEDRAPVNPPEEEGKSFLMGCIEELATIDRKEWEGYLMNNLVLDDQSLDTIPAGIYTVFIHFVIDKKGKIGDAAVFKDPGFGLGERVKKVVEKYPGSWQPAKLNDRLTASYHTQPVTFTIEEPDEWVEEIT